MPAISVNPSGCCHLRLPCEECLELATGFDLTLADIIDINCDLCESWDAHYEGQESNLNGSYSLTGTAGSYNIALGTYLDASDPGIYLGKFTDRCSDEQFRFCRYSYAYYITCEVDCVFNEALGRDVLRLKLVYILCHYFITNNFGACSFSPENVTGYTGLASPCLWYPHASSFPDLGIAENLGDNAEYVYGLACDDTISLAVDITIDCSDGPPPCAADGQEFRPSATGTLVFP